MATDFTAPLASSRVQKPEYVGLTAEQIRDKESARLIGAVSERPRPPRRWQSLPSTPEMLELLKHPHQPNGAPLPPPPFEEPIAPGPNARDEDWAAYNGRRDKLIQAWQEADRQHMVMWKWWNALDQGRKSQLAADAMWGHETHLPLWEAEHADDVEYSPVQLRAESERQCENRYRELFGIIPFEDNNTGRRHITPVLVRRLDEPKAATSSEPAEVPEAPGEAPDERTARPPRRGPR